MRNIKNIFLMLLAIFGLTSCTSIMDDIIATPEYGTPRATYNISGKVTTQSGVPLKNIMVVIGNFFTNVETKNEIMIHTDTSYTDSGGVYSIKQQGIATDEKKIIFEDIDGAENGGEFEKKSLILKNFRYDNSSDTDPWDKGVCIISNKNVTLTRRQKEK